MITSIDKKFDSDIVILLSILCDKDISFAPT